MSLLAHGNTEDELRVCYEDGISLAVCTGP